MLGDKCGRNGGGGYLGGVECLISVSCVNGKREVAPGKINFRGRDPELIAWRLGTWLGRAIDIRVARQVME